MTKSELIIALAEKYPVMSLKDIEAAVKSIIDNMTEALATGKRIELRGFGSFSLHYRAPRQGRNPKTGVTVQLSGKYVPHFKVGKELRDRVQTSVKE